MNLFLHFLLDVYYLNLKWGKESKELKNLLNTSTQKKENSEIKFMIDKNRDKQNIENEKLKKSIMKCKNKMNEENKYLKS
jgi:hypothetical protein